MRDWACRSTFVCTLVWRCTCPTGPSAACNRSRFAETLRTEVPPLLHEVSKQLKRSAGVEASLSSRDGNDDELACLQTGSGHNEGAGCSATWAPDAQGPTCSVADAPGAADAAGTAGSSAAEGGLPLDGHAVALLLTLCPPLALAASNPDNFLGALEVSKRLPKLDLAVVRCICWRAGMPLPLHGGAAPADQQSSAARPGMTLCRALLPTAPSHPVCAVCWRLLHDAPVWHPATRDGLAAAGQGSSPPGAAARTAAARGSHGPGGCAGSAALVAAARGHGAWWGAAAGGAVLSGARHPAQQAGCRCRTDGRGRRLCPGARQFSSWGWPWLESPQVWCSRLHGQAQACLSCCTDASLRSLPDPSPHPCVYCCSLWSRRHSTPRSCLGRCWRCCKGLLPCETQPPAPHLTHPFSDPLCRQHLAICPTHPPTLYTDPCPPVQFILCGLYL